jgi:AcrR family transcriptional regulator
VVTQARALQTRRTVIVAAAKVFERNGFAAATIAQILSEAGVTKGSLYFHFDSKESLARAIIDEQTDWREGQVEDRGSALERLIALSRRFAEALVDDPLVRASIRLTIERTALGEGVVAAYQGWLDAVTDLLHQAHDEGDLVATANVEATAYVITSAMTGMQLLSEAMTGREDLLARVDDFWRVLLPGLTPRRVATRLGRTLSLAV